MKYFLECWLARKHYRNVVLLSFTNCNSEYQRKSESLLLVLNVSEDVSSEEQEETYTCRILLGDDFPVYNGHRTHLPAQMRDRNPINVLQILKDCIGKDVTRITMPITLNEPLTLIQRFAENLEYVDLVSKAACLGNSLDRLEYLSAFVVSGFSGIIERVNKPFNPILGETFEMTHPVQQVRFVAEQVSHHPPISAFYIEDISENKSFKLTCSCQPKIKFLGKTVNIYVRNALELVLPHLNEKYTWGAVDCIIDNLYVGRPRIEYDGSFTIKNTNTNEFAKVQVFPTSIFNTKRPHEIEGYIYGADKTKQRYLFGFCNLEMFSVPYDETLQKEQKKLSKQLETPFSQNGTLQKRQTKALSESSQSGGLHGEESLDREKSEKNENGSDDNKDSEEPLSVKVEENYEMWKSNNSSSPSFSPKLLWKVNARPFWCQDEYNFTSFSMTLNEITGKLRTLLKLNFPINNAIYGFSQNF